MPEVLAMRTRLRGKGPVFVKCGPRIVVYRLCDLESWLASNTSDKVRKKGR